MAPPASAVAAIALSVIASRMIRAFMSNALLDLEALKGAIGLHARSSSRPPCPPRDTKTDQTHGRSVALIAQPHPKCPFQVGLQRIPSVLDLSS